MIAMVFWSSLQSGAENAGMGSDSIQRYTQRRLETISQNVQGHRREFRAGARLLALGMTDDARTFLYRSALLTEDKSWYRCTPSEILASLYGWYGLAASGQVKFLRRMARFARCERTIQRIEKNRFGDPRYVRVDFGQEVREELLSICRERIDPAPESVEQCEEFLTSGRKRTEWNPKRSKYLVIDRE